MIFYLLFCYCFAQTLSVSIPECNTSEQEVCLNPLSNSIDGRIVGGNTAIPGEFPFLAALRIQTKNGKYFCGGTLLNTEWVVTAGHCIYGAISITVYLGSTTLKLDDPNLLMVATGTYVLHPKYNPDTLENDMGLIKFREPIKYTDYIQPVNLLPRAGLSDNSSLMTMGWGQISDADLNIQEKVLYLTLKTLSNDECKVDYGYQIADSMVCAKTESNGGTCYGDTGGPLIQYVGRFQVMLVGVASFISDNGCEGGEPSGFTRVYNYVDWIQEITNFS